MVVNTKNIFIFNKMRYNFLEGDIDIFDIFGIQR